MLLSIIDTNIESKGAYAVVWCWEYATGFEVSDGYWHVHTGAKTDIVYPQPGWILEQG